MITKDKKSKLRLRGASGVKRSEERKEDDRKVREFKSPDENLGRKKKEEGAKNQLKGASPRKYGYVFSFSFFVLIIYNII